MKNNLQVLPLVVLTFLLTMCTTDIDENVDILVIGGSASGVVAGVQAARMNSNVLIIEETPWLGGMLTSAGVSAIDGNQNLPGGFWGEFRDSLSNRYGSRAALNTGWVSSVLFEPSVGNSVLHNIVGKENILDVWNNSSLVAVEKKRDLWHATIDCGGKSRLVAAKVLIDATELGDVAKMCGVAYRIGMDNKTVTGEDVAPDEANNIIQDLTYVAILKDYGKDVTIPRPQGYDATLFACSATNKLCINPKEPDRLWSAEEMITYGKLPNNKYMINWPIEGNDYYLNLIESTKPEREEALKQAKNFTLSFIYFIQTELGYNMLGLADDEYPTSDLLPFIPYHRESRRIDGVVRFNVNHIVDPYSQPEKLYRTSIAVGDYPVDHHHARYNAYDSLPNLHFHPVPSYGLPLGTLIPKEVNGIIVAEKSISVTNLVNGTTRLQPVVLQIGQAAGVLAALAVASNKEIRDVEVRDVQRELLDANAYLLPYLDVEKSDENFKIYQRIGVTGILKGEGKNVGWTNETWLRVNEPLLASDIDGLTSIYPSVKIQKQDKPLSYHQVADMIKEIIRREDIVLLHSIEKLIDIEDMSSTISRGEFAKLIDKVLDPFNTTDVDLNGNYKNQIYQKHEER